MLVAAFIAEPKRAKKVDTEGPRGVEEGQENTEGPAAGQGDPKGA